MISPGSFVSRAVGVVPGVNSTRGEYLGPRVGDWASGMISPGSFVSRAVRVVPGASVAISPGSFVSRAVGVVSGD